MAIREDAPTMAPWGLGAPRRVVIVPGTPPVDIVGVGSWWPGSGDGTPAHQERKTDHALARCLSARVA